MNLSPRLIEHAGQFAAGFELISGPGLHEQDNALKRGLESFMVVESKFDASFDPQEFLHHVCTLMECRQHARDIWIDCGGASASIGATDNKKKREHEKKLAPGH